jgi:hypothetical protein
MRAEPEKERGGTPGAETLPEWLPDSMRHNATPVERLCSLLASILALAEAGKGQLVALRAWKVQRLCEEIDRNAAAWKAAIPPENADEALWVLRTAYEFLRSAQMAAEPPVGLILAIYLSAELLARGPETDDGARTAA